MYIPYEIFNGVSEINRKMVIIIQRKRRRGEAPRSSNYVSTATIPPVEVSAVIVKDWIAIS